MIYALLLGYGIFVYIMLELIITATKHTHLNKGDEFTIYDIIPITSFIFYLFLLYAYEKSIIDSIIV